jgi:hypothetical protein
MKSSFSIISVLLVSLWFSNLNAQEVATKWDVEIPASSAEKTLSLPLSKLKPINFKVLGSRTTRMDVTKAPEMHDLPPITGTINVTVQLVKDPDLTDPPPPLPALPPGDPAMIARWAKLREKYRGTEFLFLSATVYDHKRTFLQIYPNGRVGDSVTAWSNLNFNHFSGFSTYRVKDAADGTLYDFGLLMGINSMETRRWNEIAEARGVKNKGLEIPEIPIMSNLADGGPTFIVVEGDANSPAMDTLEQIHDLYRKEGAKMEKAYHVGEKARADRKAYLLANPPKPDDVKIQFWTRNNPSPRGVQALKGGAQP